MFSDEINYLDGTMSEGCKLPADVGSFYSWEVSCRTNPQQRLRLISKDAMKKRKPCARRNVKEEFRNSICLIEIMRQ